MHVDLHFVLWLSTNKKGDPCSFYFAYLAAIFISDQSSAPDIPSSYGANDLFLEKTLIRPNI